MNIWHAFLATSNCVANINSTYNKIYTFIFIFIPVYRLHRDEYLAGREEKGLKIDLDGVKVNSHEKIVSKWKHYIM